MDPANFPLYSSDFPAYPSYYPNYFPYHTARPLTSPEPVVPVMDLTALSPQEIELLQSVGQPDDVYNWNGIVEEDITAADKEVNVVPDGEVGASNADFQPKTESKKGERKIAEVETLYDEGEEYEIEQSEIEQSASSDSADWGESELKLIRQKRCMAAVNYRNRQRDIKQMTVHEMIKWDKFCYRINKKITTLSFNNPQHPFYSFKLPVERVKPGTNSRGDYYLDGPDCLNKSQIRKRMEEFVEIAFVTVDRLQNEINRLRETNDK